MRFMILVKATENTEAGGPPSQGLIDAMGKPAGEPALKEYHLLPAVRGDLLTKLDRPAEARTEFERAAALTRNTRERELLLRRAADCHH